MNETTEHKECIADLCIRLQLILLHEGAASTDICSSLGLDASRQMRELLSCAAIWCQKPTQTKEARQTDEAVKDEAPPRSVQLHHLAATVARLMQASRSGREGEEGGDGSRVDLLECC